MHRSHLVTGHGGTAARCYGTPADSGHGDDRREAHEIQGDQVTLLPLHKLDKMLQRAPATRAMVRR